MRPKLPLLHPAVSNRNWRARGRAVRRPEAAAGYCAGIAETSTRTDF